MPYRLRIGYDDPARFRDDFERNLAMGGAFVPTPDPLQLRSLVELEVALEFADARIPLEAQVVHVVPLERALKPLEAGVIVAFVPPAQELEETLRPYLEVEPPEPDAGTADAPESADVAPPPEARFQARVHRIDSESLDLLEASVVELATAGIPLARILEVIPEDDGRIQDTLQALIERGILTTT